MEKFQRLQRLQRFERVASILAVMAVLIVVAVAPAAGAQSSAKHGVHSTATYEIQSSEIQPPAVDGVQAGTLELLPSQELVVQPSAIDGEQSFNMYIVRQGDTLYTISRDRGTSIPALMRANNLQHTFIFPGQKLIVPTYRYTTTYQDTTSRYTTTYRYRYWWSYTPSYFQPISYGMYGNRVLEVEKLLAECGYNPGYVDGYFSYATKYAVIRFQQDNGLPVTGVVDQATFMLLKQRAEEGRRPQPPAPPEPPQEPGQPGTPGQGQEPAQNLTQDEQLMVSLVNQERAQYGLAPLAVDMRLVTLARLKSQDMVNLGYFSHQSPTYGSPFDMMRRAGISYRVAGENIAGAWGTYAAHSALMNSPGHRANILNPSFTRIGVGIVSGGPYGMMFTQMFIG